MSDTLSQIIGWLAGGARSGAQPALNLMQPGAADKPFWPTLDSGGRIGEVASAISSVASPVKAPAGALGAGPVLRRASPEQFSAANKAVGDVATGAVERIPVDRLMYGQNNVVPEHVAGYTADPARITQRPLYGMEHGDDVILLDGHHRAAAAAELGLPDLPVEVLRGKALDLSPEARAARAAALGYDIDAYHSTLHGDIGSEFWPETHFGTAEAARDRVNHLTWGSPDRDPVIHPERHAEAPATYPVKLRVNKPLSVGDLASWTPADLASELYTRGMMSDAEVAAAQAGKLDPVAWLRGRGYDALRYTNRFEGKGSESYMMLDPSGVRSRHAVFDPKRAGEADILSGRAPLPGPRASPEEQQRRRERDAANASWLAMGGS